MVIDRSMLLIALNAGNGHAGLIVRQRPGRPKLFTPVVDRRATTDNTGTAAARPKRGSTARLRAPWL